MSSDEQHDLCGLGLENMVDGRGLHLRYFDLAIYSRDENMHEFESHEVLEFVSVVLIDGVHFHRIHLEVLDLLGLSVVILTVNSGPAILCDVQVSHMEARVLQESLETTSNLCNHLHHVLRGRPDGTEVLDINSLLGLPFLDGIEIEAETVLMAIQDSLRVHVVTMLVDLDSHLVTVVAVVRLIENVLAGFLENGIVIKVQWGLNLIILDLAGLSQLLEHRVVESLRINFFMSGVTTHDCDTPESCSGRQNDRLNHHSLRARGN